MAGHSHWSKIKYRKEATDAKKSQAFSKMAREITVAVREGGGNPEFNPKLKLVIEKAKSINLPAENIERAIKRGTGEITGPKLELILLEAYGPGGIAIIIEGITDNKNRALTEIKQILSQYNGKLADQGSVKWMFERKEKKGRLEWTPKYEIEIPEKDRGVAEKLFEALDESDSIQEIYSNLKI